MNDSLKRIETDVVACRACTRLVAHRETVAREKRRAFRDLDYWGRPVPAFGDPNARLVLIGLAPGAHGSNRTGRMFTGDASGDTLFAALHAAGFASAPSAVSRDDGLRLDDCFITAAARCAPPGNKPTPDEFATCFPYLLREMRLLREARVWLALGALGFGAALRAARELDFEPEATPHFGHGSEVALASGRRRIVLLASYHPSRQNTQTGRLTPAMFAAVFTRARQLL